MPIYCGFPADNGDEITYKDFITLPRIPTASVLLRIDYASIDFDGEFVSINDPDPERRALAYEAAPEYSDQKYATTYYLISDIEREIFTHRKTKSTDANLQEVLEALAEVLAVPSENE